MEAKDMNEMEPRIIEAAKRVFVRKGYEAATMSDVAAEVGIGRTALHYYYRTKEILFDAIFGQLLSSLLPNIDRVLDEKSTMHIPGCLYGNICCFLQQKWEWNCCAS